MSIKKQPLECKKIKACIPDNRDLYEFMSGIRYLNFVGDVYQVPAGVREKRIAEYSADMGITVKNSSAAVISMLSAVIVTFLPAVLCFAFPGKMGMAFMTLICIGLLVCLNDGMFSFLHSPPRSGAGIKSGSKGWPEKHRSPRLWTALILPEGSCT